MFLDYIASLTIFIVFFIVFIVLIFGAITFGENKIKKQAFERGYMIQCVGKTGYHWECE